ncbi:MAG: hypothetical protein AB1921_04575 [Thermodesulfobacteriota bacterium]
MGFEPGGMGDKLGNRYERRWVAKQLLRLLNEEIQSVTVELVGADEDGVDLLVVTNDGVRQLQQCRARNASNNSWSVKNLAANGIFAHVQTHLSRDARNEFAFVSGIPATLLADICDSARNSNDNSKDFFTYQIKQVGKAREDAFRVFCNSLSIDTGQSEGLEKAFGYLKRTYIELFPNDRNAWLDLLTRAGFLLTGDPETAIAVLLAYAENTDNFHRPITSDELRTHLAERHDIFPKRLDRDRRVFPAIEESQRQFCESIHRGLINGRIIPRSETAEIIEHIASNKDIVVHGAAGFGKSGVLYELAEYLSRQNIPFLPVRLDRRVPERTAKHFGEAMGLPDSPAYSLASVAAGRKCVLILDQLDSIRWTSAHSGAAMDVCKELVRQVRSLRREGREIVLVFACRTFDLEHDQEIKNLLAGGKDHNFIEISVKAFSEEQLKAVLGNDYAYLPDSQKRILSCPQNLSIWMDLRECGTPPVFRTATELMRRYWENHRRIFENLDRFLQPIVDYMEREGEVSAPAVIAGNNPALRDRLISNGILQESSGRICFSHQRYLDYLIAERLLARIVREESSVLSWLGPKGNQSLFRREQLRQVLSMLAEQSPKDYFDNIKQILESSEVRFHIKHLVLELTGQLIELNDNIEGYFIKLLDDIYWRDHIIETVFIGNPLWISCLLKNGIISKWLYSGEEQDINRALWLLCWVIEAIPGKVAEVLEPLIELGEGWPERILSTLGWNMADDSEKMFELRLKLSSLGYISNFVDWKSLCNKHPMRAITLIEVVLSTWKINDDHDKDGQKSRMERWYGGDVQALEAVVRRYPIQAWDHLMPQIERMTNFKTHPYDPKLERWQDYRSYLQETDIARGVVDLVMVAGQTMACEQPDELIARVRQLEGSHSTVVQEIIISAYSRLSATHADEGVAWLLGDTTRFRLGSGLSKPEWMPAVRLIKGLSPLCSVKLFRHLEQAIIHYHDPEERTIAKYRLKRRKEGIFDHYWGQTQFVLLPALDSGRIERTTADLIQVLERKFERYPKTAFLKASVGSGGLVVSKIDKNLEKISDRAWINIANSSNITENGTRPWIQVDPNHVEETSVHTFARSLARIATRFPERFAKLALQFPDDVHPEYISAIIDGCRKSQPGTELPQEERDSWRPAYLETIEKVLKKCPNEDDEEIAMSFCRLIEERSEESWSAETVTRLVRYARYHPDPRAGKLNIYCDQSSTVASVATLFQNTLNCVRAVAASAIGKLLWTQNDIFELVRPGIEALIQDPHPVVRMAAIKAIEPVMNIDKNLAVEWFCITCKDDLRVAASQRALRLYNYLMPSNIIQIGNIVRQMVDCPLHDVSLEGAKEIATRWLFHGLFEDEFAKCRTGTLSQRKGVSCVAAYFISDHKYSKQCRELLICLINDPEKEVREEVNYMLRSDILFTDPVNKDLLKKYIESLSFRDNPEDLIHLLESFDGSLYPIAWAIFLICEQFSTTMIDRANEMGRYSTRVSEMSSILLRLYEQATREENLPIANQCLDIWDMLFENRAGRVIELSRSIDK